jgi:hypothetical protein
MIYECKCCKYKTIYKTNFDKHLLTKKHKTNSAIVDDKPFTCKYCSQKYKYKQSLSKHVKYSCTKNKDEDLKELVRLLNNKLENQDKEIKDQSKQIEKLKGKLEINNSFNTNTTVNNIQNITLLSYTETDTSHLTDHDYKKCIETKNWCVVKMIEKVHFNPKKPENMNLYIPNMKDKYVMMYEDGNWNIKHKSELDTLYEEKEMLLEEWINEEQHKYPELTNIIEEIDIKMEIGKLEYRALQYLQEREIKKVKEKINEDNLEVKKPKTRRLFI